MIRKFIAAFVIFFLSATTAFAAEDYVDWGNNVIRVTGWGAGPKNWDKNDSFYKTFARQAARIDALRRLVEELESAVNQYDVSSTSVMENFELVECKMVVRISQDSPAFKLLEKNARQVGNAGFSEDGACTVTMEIILPANWKEHFKK